MPLHVPDSAITLVYDTLDNFSGSDRRQEEDEDLLDGVRMGQGVGGVRLALRSLAVVGPSSTPSSKVY